MRENTIRHFYSRTKEGNALTETAAEEQGKEKIRKPLRVDPSFKREVLKTLGGETLKICYNCGTCTSSCPIARFTESFRPRKMFRMAVLGLRERILSGEDLWLCLDCYTCDERCPQDVKPSELIGALKRIAVRAGRIHPVFRKEMDLIANDGRLYEITDFENDEREMLGLPPVPPVYVKEVKKIVKRTGLDKLAGIDWKEEPKA
jgi:heterodisulfide reductase subunit C